MTTPAQLTAQIVDLLTRWNSQQDQLADWLTGAPAGGPNGDGRYPLTNAEGTTELFQSLPSILNAVSGPAAAAQDAQAAAELALSLAQAAQAAAEAAQTATANSQSAVLGLRTIVDTQQSDVAAKWSDVNFWHGQVGTNTLTVETATTAVLGYRDETLLARDDTLIARDQAQVARDEAQGFAASIDPSLLATKAELQTSLNALVDAAPGTLDTLNEIAAALGDDPNFATTVTTQLAGKAPLSHTHVIGDVTGLQTALDGKQPVGSYAASAHTHVIGDVTGLQGALDGKASLSGANFTGNVGIGTSSPGVGRLRVLQGANQVAFLSEGGNTPGYPQFGFSGQTADNGGRGAGMYLPGDGTVAFSTTATERLRIDSAGNVGIGTTAPGQKLHVSGNVLTVPAAGWSSGQVAYNYLGDTNNGISATNGGYTNVFGFSGISFSAVGFGGEKMRIEPSGNVGIGTSSPGFILDVQGSTVGTSRINVLRTGGAGVGVQLLSTGGIAGLAATNAGPLQLFTSDLARMTVTAAGNVGIGLTNPSERLHVSGNAIVTGSLVVGSVDVGQKLAELEFRLQAGGL